MDVMAELKKRGLKITYDTRMGGGAARNSIYSVTFPLSAQEWCELCMRDGEFYVGGCCGQTSAIQDHFNSIFRDSGVADAGDVLDLMAAAGTHGGFEEYSATWEGDLGKLVKRWNKLSPVKKIGVCCQAVKGKIAKNPLGTPHPKKKTDDWCDVLEGGLRLMSYQDLIQRDGNKIQEHANRQELLARIMPACRKVLEEVIPKLSKPFEGFAITKAGGMEVVSDSYGLCLYASEKAAREKVEFWAKNAGEDEKPFLKTLEVKPVNVSVEQGIKFD